MGSLFIELIGVQLEGFITVIQGVNTTDDGQKSLLEETYISKFTVG